MRGKGPGTESARRPFGGRNMLTLLVTVALLAAACSSTTGSQDVGPDGGTTQVLDGGRPGADGAGGPGGAFDPTATTNGQPGGVAVGPGPAGSSGSGKPTRGVAKLEMGRGVTAKTIQVGLTWGNTEAAQAAMTAIAGPQARTFEGDAKVQGEAIIAYINNHGGVAGRKLVAVWHESDVTGVTTREGAAREAQRQCATFTEDHQVFAFALTDDDLLRECARRTGTVAVATLGASSVDRQRFDELKDVYYGPASLDLDRRDVAQVEGLWRQGFFGQGAKVGILAHDSAPVRRSVEKNLLPALAKHGLKAEEVVFYPHIIESPWQNYVVQFQQRGVTHVIWGNGIGYGVQVILFMQAAENQQYRPFHGLATDIDPAGTNDFGAPEEQMLKVRGVGWMPIIDVSNEKQWLPKTSSAQVCLKIMERADQPTGPWARHFGTCEFLFFLKAVLDRADALTAEGFRWSAEALRRSYVPVTTWETLFLPGRHDGVTQLRNFVYSGGCSCLKYVGDRYPAPS